MIKKLTEKIKLQKGELVRYDFVAKCTGVAGFCPDCGEIVSFVAELKKYICINPDCDFEADINRERIWNNDLIEIPQTEKII